ncbi:MAG: LysM peptidoglycan-binding domain-containing protein [Planctomycetes bacterium]|nr:LysM peptidoglycan-binding domain-containing protein [Planctomycetota bacterium]
MGQLEKYGLYVLCLLIFLILGVTLWGSGEIKDRGARERSVSKDLNATTVGDEVERSNGGRPIDATAGSGGGNKAALPDFKALLQPQTPPKKDPTIGKGGRAVDVGEGGGPNQPEVPVVNPEPPAPPPASTARGTHVIKSGDNFESIALKYFGERLLRVEISRLNPKLDPRRLQVDQEVVLPSAAEVEQFLAKRRPSRPTTVVGSSYTIVGGDTIEGIASRLLGSRKRSKEIQDLNPGVDPTNLKIGSTLRLPKK